MNIAAVLAGGSGKRMGSAVPKQFLPVNGIPVIIRSINAFVKNSNTDMCVVSVGREYIEKTQELIDKYICTHKKIFVIAGGSTRGDTLFGVLEFLRMNGWSKNSVIITHDAVRPFITDRIIDENIEKAREYGAVNTCIPAVDTMLISSDGEFIESVPDRKNIFHAQTPQSFDCETLYSLIESTPREEFLKLTDGCSVFIYHGRRVAMVQGETYNIKITYPEDIGKAEITAKEYFD